MLVIEFLQIGLAIVLFAIVYWIIDFFMLGEEAPTPNPVAARIESIYSSGSTETYAYPQYKVAWVQTEAESVEAVKRSNVPTFQRLQITKDL